MLIRHANVFVDGGFVRDLEVRVHNGRVQEMGYGLMKGLYEEELDLHGDYLLPGFVDVHIHAFRRHDTMDGEQAVRGMSRELFKEGVSAFCPTTMSASVEDTRNAVTGIARVVERQEIVGSRVLGAHMEAPFLQTSKAGAQRQEFFMDPSMAAFEALTGGHTDAVRILTMAPERNGSEAFIREATGKGVVISIGHTSATAEQVHQAADWGANHVTHTFNAQTALHHRNPGVPGAAMVDDRIYCEMICDGIHLHGDIVRLLARTKGAKRAVAITDAMEAAGMPDGEYALGGQPVFVKAGEARLADGTLAGSVLTMHGALENLIHRFGVVPEEAVQMCTSTPADSIGEKLAGRMQPGSPAPLTRWSAEWKWLGILA